MKEIAALAFLFSLAACGSRTVWEPANDNITRYGSWTDEDLLLAATQGAVTYTLDAHPPSPDLAVAIRVPHDPDGYGAAALLADGLERGGAQVSWIADDGVAPVTTRQRVEIWEVATSIRGAVTKKTDDDPPYRRDALVEIRVSSVGPDGHFLWNDREAAQVGRPVNLYFRNKKSVPRAYDF